MSIVFVHETAFDRTSTQDVNPRTLHVRVFDVLTDDINDDQETVRTAVDPSNGLAIPARWAILLTNPFLSVARITTRPDRNEPKLHHVRVEYDTTVRDEGESDPDPLARTPIVDWFSVPATKPAVNARFLGPTRPDNTTDPTVLLTNSAGITFPESLFMDASRLAVRITRNELVFPVDLSVQYQDAINSDVFLTVNAGQAKVQNIRAIGPITENQVTFLKVTYEIHFRREGWILEHIDEGKYQINLANPLFPGQPFHIPCVDGLGNPVADVVPLDGVGQQAILFPGLAPGSASYNTQFVKLRFGVYDFLPFAALNLG